MTQHIEGLILQISRYSNFHLLLLLAGMGAGKDFVGKLLQEYGSVSFHHLSCSAAIRRRAKESGPVGDACAAAEEKMKCAEMVEDELATVVVLEWILQRLQAGVRTFLLDGFPRNDLQFAVLRRLEELKGTHVIARSILLCQPFGICLAQVLGQRRKELCRADDNITTFLHRWHHQFLARPSRSATGTETLAVQQTDKKVRKSLSSGVQMERLKAAHPPSILSASAVRERSAATFVKICCPCDLNCCQLVGDQTISPRLQVTKCPRCVSSLKTRPFAAAFLIAFATLAAAHVLPKVLPPIGNGVLRMI